MKHTNPIIIKILTDEYSDYPENNWHYNRRYKMMQKAIDAQQLSSKVEGKTADYKTELTLEELKGHYEMHFLPAEQFIDLISQYAQQQTKAKGVCEKEIIEHFSNMSGDERVEFIYNIQEGFCKHCGLDENKYGECHCGNDD